MKVQSAIERKLTRARTQLLLNQPFFGTLCLRLKLVAGELPTMATDGRRILYAPAFVDELTRSRIRSGSGARGPALRAWDIIAAGEHGIHACGMRPQTWRSIPF